MLDGWWAKGGARRLGEKLQNGAMSKGRAGGGREIDYKDYIDGRSRPLAPIDFRALQHPGVQRSTMNAIGRGARLVAAGAGRHPGATTATRQIA